METPKYKESDKETERGGQDKIEMKREGGAE